MLNLKIGFWEVEKVVKSVRIELLTLLLCWDYNLGMGKEGGSEVGPNRPHKVPEATAGSGLKIEAAKTVNHIEAFLGGNGFGSAEYKVVSDQVALFGAGLKTGAVDLREVRISKEPEVVAVKETIRARKTEADSLAYEDAEIRFTQVVTQYLFDQIRIGNGRTTHATAFPDTVVRMREDFDQVNEKLKSEALARRSDVQPS